MLSRKLRCLPRVLSLSALVFLSAFVAFAAEDGNPNSPTPVLLSAPDSTRALAVEANSFRGSALPKPQSRAFNLNQTVVLFLTNIDLMPGEGANAFRVYIQDAQGREYRFPVLDIQPIKSKILTYALTVELKDELGFWEPTGQRGDVLVRVAWRGLTSNRVRLGLGTTGGDIKDAAGSVPTPYSESLIQPADKERDGANRVGYRWSGDRIRFLEQATFGPTAALDERIRRIGLRTWLAEQFEAPYPSVYPYPDVPLNATSAPPTCNGNNTPPDPVDIPVTCRRDTYTMYLPQTWFYKEAFYGSAQLRHRVAWSLSQIWVVSGLDTQQSSWFVTYYQQLGKNAFGNWKNLMTDVTLNPAMGNYLDMIRSTRNNPNENYAREVLQLFNIGLFMLNQDGTLQLDANDQPIPTYDQNTVNNFTKVFTGWQTCEVTGATCPNRTTAGPNYKDPLILNNANLHDITAKTLLSYPGSTTTDIAACAGCTGANTINYGNASLAQAIRNIYEHPNVAPFVSKLLIQHLVTSDPSPAYVGRVSAVFNANRENPAQMREVIRAILLDPEARGDVKTDPRFGKLREPVQLATNIYRHFDVRSFDGLQPSDGNVDRYPSSMGQRALYPPTVFNYYPPDYVVPGTSVLAPEFGIFTTGTSIARANAINNIVFNRINVSNPDTPNGTSINLSEMQTLATADPTGNLILDALNTKMMHGAMSAEMRSMILTAVQAAPSNNPLLRAQTAVYLIATSSQYQVQR